MDKLLFSQMERLPKIELHLHIEGGVRYKTMQDFLATRGRNISLVNQNWRNDNYQYKDLVDFVATISSTMDICIRKPEDYHRIATETFVDLSEQNVRYAEISFDLGRAVRLGMPFDEVLSAIGSARQNVIASHPIRIGLILALNRYLSIDILNQMAQLAVDSKNIGIVGIDLHGDESINTPSHYAEPFDIARKGGLGLRAHAGEAEGADRVWETIKSLGVSRIGHGISSLEDEKLIDYLVTHKIILEVCPTSNYKLNLVPSLSEHPIRALFDLGVPVTVNSDDPLFFNTTITNEYYVIAKDLGFTLSELKDITLNAANGAFLNNEEKEILHQEIKRDFPVENKNRPV